MSVKLHNDLKRMGLRMDQHIAISFQGGELLYTEELMDSVK